MPGRSVFSGSVFQLAVMTKYTGPSTFDYVQGQDDDEKAKANADPPFDFAQGRLFGDDNKRGKANGKDEGRRRSSAGMTARI
jgi:hypothetical protein